VIGIFNLRGDIVPLFDVAALLGIGAVASPEFAVVIECALGPAGLAASGVPEAVALTEPIGPAETPGTAGLYVVGDRIVTLLDLDILIEPDRVGR
jgi:chemotaxis signal transduction protein